MASYHQTIIVGNLGGDVDSRYMPNGDAVANFGVAVTETWKDQGGNKQERTTWYRVIAYRRLAEICGQYLKKGSPVMIVGRMQAREWEKDGVKRTSWELHADSMQMLGQRPAGDGEQRSSSGGGDYQRARDGGSGPRKPASNVPPGDFEDDIPFLSNETHFDDTLKMSSSIARAKRGNYGENLSGVQRYKADC